MSKILIIDDDPTARLIISKALRGEGYKVDFANDGEMGLRKAQEISPSLIICDWMMPLMNGLELCRNIKGSARLSSIYFILLTSRDDVKDLVKGLENGADDFLNKPIHKAEIKARVRAGLRLHQANKDLEFQKSRLEAEQAQAAEYVRSLLPKTLNSCANIYSYFQPSQQLGGDSFDFYWLDQDNLILYLLDVSGHGISAALLSVSVLNLLRTKGLRGKEFEEPVDLSQPSQVLRTLNEYFQMSKYNDLYFTIWYGSYNKNTRTLTYSSAGHPPAVLITNQPKQSQQLKTSGLPIGIIPKAVYQDAFCQIKPNDELYVFSDGVYEITQKDGKIRTLENFLEVLVNLEGDSKPEQAAANASKISKFGNQFEDDFSLLHIQFDAIN